MVSQRRERGIGVAVPAAAVGRGLDGVTYTECLRADVFSGRLEHRGIRTSRGVISTLLYSTADSASLNTTCTSGPPAEDDLMLLRLSMVAGGPPEHERRFAVVCQWGRGASPPHPPRWPAAARWLWGATSKSRVDVTVNRMVRAMLGHCKTESEGWHTHSSREATARVSSNMVSMYVEWIFGQCVSTWGGWLCRHELTCIRRMMGRESADDCIWEADLAVACQMRSNLRRLRVGDVGKRPWWRRGESDGDAHTRGRPRPCGTWCKREIWSLPLRAPRPPRAGPVEARSGPCS